MDIYETFAIPVYSNMTGVLEKQNGPMKLLTFGHTTNQSVSTPGHGL